MPKKTPNYAQSCIYKLCCKNPLVKEEYVGSTTSFRKRKNQHKTVCTNEKDKRFHCRVYKHIRANGGWENWDMVEVAKVDAIDERDLERIERTYIESSVLLSTVRFQQGQQRRDTFRIEQRSWSIKRNCIERTSHVSWCIRGSTIKKTHMLSLSISNSTISPTKSADENTTSNTRLRTRTE